MADQDGPRHTLETLRNTQFTCAAVLGARGRQTVLRLSTTPLWWNQFHQALARFLSDSLNCRAVIKKRLVNPGHPPLAFE